MRNGRPASTASAHTRQTTIAPPSPIARPEASSRGFFVVAGTRSRPTSIAGRAAPARVRPLRQGRLFAVGALAGLVTLAASSACVDQTFMGAAPSSPTATSPRGSPTPDPPPTHPTTGALAGRVLVGPFSTTYTPGSSGSLPVIGATVIVTSLATLARVGSGVTDASGVYTIPLAAGTYLVTLSTSVQYASTTDVPATVQITAGQTTTLTIQLDTGLR